MDQQAMDTHQLSTIQKHPQAELIDSRNPPHIERLLNILRDSSQSRLPLQVKKSMEFNPVLGKYLDCKRDEDVHELERKAS